MVSTWDILSGDVKPGSNVLLYDDAEIMVEEFEKIGIAAEYL